MKQKMVVTMISGAVLLFLSFSVLGASESPVSTRAGIETDSRWILVGEPIVNPNNKRTSFIVGVTPGYYSDRNKGSFDRWSVTASVISRNFKWVNHEIQEMDVSLSVKFNIPRVLIPGEVVNINVEFSSSGTVEIGNPGCCGSAKFGPLMIFL